MMTPDELGGMVYGEVYTTPFGNYVRTAGGVVKMSVEGTKDPIYKLDTESMAGGYARLRLWEADGREDALYFQADQRHPFGSSETAGGYIEFADAERLIDALHEFWNKGLRRRRREEAEVKVQELTIERNAAKKRIEEAQEEIRRINIQLQEAHEKLSEARPIHETYVYDEEAHLS